jgi:pimeloyl-ACP methyl ester carboxylesterase
MGACFIGPSALAGDPAGLEGYWQGAFSRHGSVQLMNVRLGRQGDSLVGNYEIPEMGLFDEPLTEVAVSDSQLRIHVLYGTFGLHRHDAVGQLTGLNENWKPSVSLHLKKLASAPAPWYLSEPVTFTSDGVRLAGTIVLPVGPGPYPALVAIPGSGNQGRATWEYRSHAYALARQGIAVLLYDKRGVGESEGQLAATDFSTLARDATAALAALRQRLDVLPQGAGFLGISQGGWIAAIACRLGAKPDLVVLLQGPAVSLEEQELDRVEYSMRAEEYGEAAIDSAVAHTRTYFAFVNTSADWPTLAASSESVSKAAWADFVNRPASPDDSDIAWWRRNAYDPRDDLQRLRCPVLAIFGEIDPNVPPQENRVLMEELLTRAGVDFEIAIIPGLPHSVTTYQTLEGGEWNWPQHYWVWARRPISLDSAITNWLKATLQP